MDTRKVEKGAGVVRGEDPSPEGLGGKDHRLTQWNRQHTSCSGWSPLFLGGVFLQAGASLVWLPALTF